MTVKALEIDALVRSINVNRNSPHAIFLGAGASITSGIPSAGECIWQWKRAIFCTRNPGLEDQVNELSLPIVRDRINHWLVANNYIPDEGIDEYSYFIEKFLPIADDRRRFFEPWIRKARPHIGYNLLCLLAEYQIFHSIWTTNFDALATRAAANFDLTPIQVGFDCQDRVFRQPTQNELVCVSLHGDYRYDLLKNTTEELQEQEKNLISALVETLRTQSLIVNGYSGRDASVMNSLHKALIESPGTGKIFWCGFSDKPTDSVTQLLIAANNAGRDAYFVPGAAFDDVMTRLSLHCLEGEKLSRAKTLIGDASSSAKPKRDVFKIIQEQPTTLAKSNAWVLHCPSEMFEFDLLKWPEKKVWKWLEEKTKNLDIVAVPFKKVLAFGTLDCIRDSFKDLIKGEIKRVPITDKDIYHDDKPVVNLLRKSLVRAIAAKRLLNTDGHSLIWKKEAFESRKYAGCSYDIYRATFISLRRVGSKFYITLEPTVYIPSRSDDDANNIRSIRSAILGYQHNKEYGQELSEWQKEILDRKGRTEFDFPPKSAAFKFEISCAPAFAGISQKGKPSLRFPENFQPSLIHHRGIEVSEPNLRFTETKGQLICDTLPIRGLVNNGPFDQNLYISGIDKNVNIAVICPQMEAPFLEEFLNGIIQQHNPQRGLNEEYLLSYSGFEKIFRTPISIPQRGDSRWLTLSEPASHLDQKEGALELARKIREAISSLSTLDRSVVLILTPERWRKWRNFETEEESFDVHDFVKAYSVQQGIATQFLDQDTIKDPDKCRIWWWLSIALYAKAMRTPWVLEGLDPDSAFVGLGYAVNRKAKSSQRIVLGCSHLYNSQGQGLQFRLSRIDNPIMYGKNPFLSFEDARRLGEIIRTLFWEAHLKLPRRVVIHKLTPFLVDEQKGLQAGLEGVQDLDLLEINNESSLRYVSSQQTQNGFHCGGYPVRRGTTIKLTDYEALLWVHGSTDATKVNRTYFQGKRRIPSPIVLRRHAGNSDLVMLATEILGLSKMDWNSGDLYGKLPTTVLSSKRIAQIGSLLDRFGTTSYDYRLFM
jgi:hypothetical protein